MDFVVSTGDIKLADKLIELGLSSRATPNLDIAAEANRFAILKHLNDLERERKLKCTASGRLAEHAARTGNTEMFLYIANHCKQHLLGEKRFVSNSLLTAAAKSGKLAMVKLVFSYQCREGIRQPMGPGSSRSMDRKDISSAAPSYKSYGEIMEYLSDPHTVW